MNAEERRFNRESWKMKQAKRKAEHWHHWEKYHNHRLGKIVGGLIFIAIGVLFIAREMGTVLPPWLFSWEMLLVAIGVYVGAKHSFRHPIWVVMVAVGVGFLLDDIYPGISIGRYFWPIAFIAIGLIVIFKPRRKMEHHWEKWQRWEQMCRDKKAGTGTDDSTYFGSNATFETSEDRLDTTCLFGGVKKNVISKDFKGGEVTCVMGGAEINLMNADINGRVILEVTQVMGGTTLIIPAHWEVQSDMMVTVFGNIEDKRPLQQNTGLNPEKVLVIRGTTVLGGLDIKSY